MSFHNCNEKSQVLTFLYCNGCETRNLEYCIWPKERSIRKGEKTEREKIMNKRMAGRYVCTMLDQIIAGPGKEEIRTVNLIYYPL